MGSHGIDVLNARIATIHPWLDCHFWPWSDYVVLETWGDDQWIQTFQMREQVFMELCKQLTPTLRHQSTLFWKPTPLQKGIAIALGKLARTDSCQLVANQFEVGKSTAGVVIVQVCHPVSTVIYVQMVAKPKSLKLYFKGCSFHTV